MKTTSKPNECVSSVQTSINFTNKNKCNHSCFVFLIICCLTFFAFCSIVCICLLKKCIPLILYFFLQIFWLLKFMFSVKLFSPHILLLLIYKMLYKLKHNTACCPRPFFTFCSFRTISVIMRALRKNNIIIVIVFLKTDSFTKLYLFTKAY